MSHQIRRIFVEKKEGFNVEAKHLTSELKETLKLDSLKDVRILNRYDFTCKDAVDFEKIVKVVFSEPNVDVVYEDELPGGEDKVLAVEYLPGQYDQRADSAEQCIGILLEDNSSKVKAAKIYIFSGSLTNEEYIMIKEYMINPIDSREASMDLPMTLDDEKYEVSDIQVVDGFIEMDDKSLEEYRRSSNFAMSFDDILMIRDYFRDDEKRNPTVTELKVIDTYWSDHCRHTTFFTEIQDIKLQEGKYKKVLEVALEDYLQSRKDLSLTKPVTLMDLATINAKESKKLGLLDDLDISEEINACSIEIDVDIDGVDEKWLLMFKNETHNHPTEIEPFGGAATCLGGAIRDPLSGRSYVYQAMRVTGSGDPRQPLNETLPGKLPQRKITREAAKGYSSYGNQIGLATGQVTEVYHKGYVAKRMEVGAVIAAAPKYNVIRSQPEPGDIILLVGGKTGRDGIGGATGSSKSHTEESLIKSGAEVQKGNAPEERKIQRLFRNPALSRLIKRCNDFGAGGVSVAIGELADSLEINLDVVPKKYDGLDGTELAISESQERMAVVINPKDYEKFLELTHEENLQVTKVADVTDTNRLVMKWRGESILDIKRSFLNTNGAKQFARVELTSPEKEREYKENIGFREGILEALSDLNVCSQQGMNAMFDNTVGASTVLMPLGGKYRLAPSEGMVAKIPVLKGNTNTCSIMTYGFDPYLCEWSPFHGGVYSVIESVAKVVALGGDRRKVRLSMQEYFEKLESDPVKWGKPFSALLGAYSAQKELGIAAIGGKDSMSGTFKDISVPPTIISFAVTHDKVDNIISSEFKKEDSSIYLFQVERDENQMPNYNKLRFGYDTIKRLVDEGKILSAKTVSKGGVAAAIAKMSFGNKIGFEFKDMKLGEVFSDMPGSIIIELASGEDLPEEFKLIGTTIIEAKILFGNEEVSLDQLIKAWQEPLSKVFVIKEDELGQVNNLKGKESHKAYGGIKISKPRVFIPVFPGTNSEYDSVRAFEKAGGEVSSRVFRNQSTQDIEESLKEWEEEIKNSQILMIPGGFSAGDEPDGSGKFIATVFRNPRLSDAVMDLLKNRDGLVLGVCNGFQALIKLGLLPYGDIRDIGKDDPTLTFNKIGRHISQVSPTRIASKLSPWLKHTEIGEIYYMPFSHGEGRFVADEQTLNRLIDNGQIATQYVDLSGNATYDGTYNPNGSMYAVEGLTSPDGRVFGKMGHSERIGYGVYKNIPGEKDQRIFQAGIEYFK